MAKSVRQNVPSKPFVSTQLGNRKRRHCPAVQPPTPQNLLRSPHQPCPQEVPAAVASPPGPTALFLSLFSARALREPDPAMCPLVSSTTSRPIRAMTASGCLSFHGCVTVQCVHGPRRAGGTPPCTLICGCPPAVSLSTVSRLYLLDSQETLHAQLDVSLQRVPRRFFCFCAKQQGRSCLAWARLSLHRGGAASPGRKGRRWVSHAVASRCRGPGPSL